MNNLFILYAVKDNEIYYISNTNPIVWSSNIIESKIYYSKYSAELDILRNYDNYRYISKLFDNNKLDSLYVAVIDINYIEKGRVKLL